MNSAVSLAESRTLAPSNGSKEKDRRSSPLQRPRESEDSSMLEFKWEQTKLWKLYPMGGGKRTTENKAWTEFIAFGQDNDNNHP